MSAVAESKEAVFVPASERTCLQGYHEGLDRAFVHTLNPIDNLGSRRVGFFRARPDTLANCFKTIPLHYADKCAVYSSYYINRIGNAEDSRQTGKGLGAAILRTIALVFSVLARVAVFTVVLTAAAVFSYLIPILPLFAYYQHNKMVAAKERAFDDATHAMRAATATAVPRD